MYKNLKALRQSLNMTQKEFAASLGIGYTTYNGYETGARDPKSDFWVAVAEKYHVTIDYLMGYSNDPYKTITRTSMVPPLIASKLSEIADEYRRTHDQDRLVDEMVKLDAQDQTALLSFALKIIHAVEKGKAVVVDDDGKPIQPRTGGPQDAPAPSEGKDTAPAADGLETPPEGPAEGKR